MSEEKNIKQFTAADIEKYHKGLLSRKEMHELEKAALEDPFLADALEGYAVAGVQAEADLAELRKRLAEKTSSAKVIPMAAAPKNSFRILRAAVVIAFIAGAGLLVYQFGFTKKEESIAKTETKESAAPATGDSSAKAAGTDPGVNKDITSSSTPVANEPVTAPAKPAPKDGESKPFEGTGESKTAVPVPSDTRSVTVTDDGISRQPVTTIPATEAPAPPAPARERALSNKPTDIVNIQKEGKQKQEEVENAKRLKSDRNDKDVALSRDETGGQARRQAAPVNMNNIPGNNRDQVQNSNFFRGRVTDADNNAVPFANVRSLQDENASTYTDAKGNFTLAATDSVLNVQVRSVGYENNNVQLRNSVPSNQVVLQNNSVTLEEVVVTGYGVQKKTTPPVTNVPVPADGWDKYRLYIANNRVVPSPSGNQQNVAGEVVVSFEVNKNGKPLNFRVDKSLSPACDQEAIRVVKDGPKWKRGGKNTRATISVIF